MEGMVVLQSEQGSIDSSPSYRRIKRVKSQNYNDESKEYYAISGGRTLNFVEISSKSQGLSYSLKELHSYKREFTANINSYEISEPCSDYESTIRAENQNDYINTLPPFGIFTSGRGEDFICLS